MEHRTATDPPHGSWFSTLESSKPRMAQELKVNYKKDRYFGQQLEDLTNVQMRGDFRTMGFDEDSIGHMMKREETVVDGYAQLPNYSQGFVHKDPSNRPKENVPEDRMIGKTNLPPTYKHCAIHRTRSNWVLYDDNIPVWKYGKSSLRKEFTPWMRYAPGNIRIVMYNIKTGSIGLSWVPKHFNGHEVVYTENGPRLVPIDASQSILREGRPVKEPRRQLRRSFRSETSAVRYDHGSEGAKDNHSKNARSSIRHPFNSARQGSEHPLRHIFEHPITDSTPRVPRRVQRIITSPPDESVSNGKHAVRDKCKALNDEQEDQEASIDNDSSDLNTTTASCLPKYYTSPTFSNTLSSQRTPYSHDTKQYHPALKSGKIAGVHGLQEDELAMDSKGVVRDEGDVKVDSSSTGQKLSNDDELLRDWSALDRKPPGALRVWRPLEENIIVARERSNVHTWRANKTGGIYDCLN